MDNKLKSLGIDEELFQKFSNEMKKHDLDCCENEMIALYLISKAQIDAEHEIFFNGVGIENNIKGI